MTNDNYNDRSEYSRITWPEVREGDVLMHANGDRLTVSVVDHVGYQTCKAAGAWRSVSSMTDAGFFPYRKVDPLPTTPGAYLDKDGGLCVLGNEGLRSGSAHWMHFGRSVDNYVWLTDRVARARAPFTRLVPMPTEEQLRETLFKTDPGTIYGVDAVVKGMKSLLGGGDDE